MQRQRELAAIDAGRMTTDAIAWTDIDVACNG
jgi:hypothetical protein